MAAPRWDPARFTLRFQIGEFTVWRKTFAGLSLATHYFDLSTDPLEPRPPFDRLGKEVEVIVTRSHPYREPLPQVSREGAVLRYVRDRYSRFHTDLAGTFEDYLGKFSTKTRGTLRRKVRRFSEQGVEWSVVTYRQPDEMAEFHRLARQVSALTYQEKLLDAGIPDSADYLDELVRLAEKDDVRAYVLMLGGQPIAYLCCPGDNGILLYGYLGYDPAHAGLSPGTVLQYLAFESLFAEAKFRAFDFTEGQGEHKRLFGTHETPCADICYFPATIPARFWVGLHVLVTNFSRAVVKLLERTGLKSKIKNFLRRR